MWNNRYIRSPWYTPVLWGAFFTIKKPIQALLHRIGFVCLCEMFYGTSLTLTRSFSMFDWITGSMATSSDTIAVDFA